MRLSVHSSAVYNSQDVEISSVPPEDEWIKKTWHMYTVGYGP